MKSEHILDDRSVIHAREHRTARRAEFPRLWHFTFEYLIALPIGVAIGLAWANLAPEGYFRMASRAAFAVNDVGMVLFFGWITKEIVEATLPGGALHSWKRTALPVAGSTGLVVAPALLYGAIVRLFDEPMLYQAWPVTAATDLAAGYLLVRLIFGRGPAVPFFLLLAISANAIGFALLAVAGSGRGFHPLLGTLLMSAALGVVFALRSARVRSFWPYVLTGGGLAWAALYFAGLHPAFALLPVLPFLPHARRDPGFFVDAKAEARDALNRFELWARYPAQAALLLFGIVNGGVQLRALESGVFSLPLAVVLAKPIGLFAAVGLALLAGLHLPRQLGWRHLVVLGCIASVGFTLALFFATAILGIGQVLNETKIGALISVTGAGVAIAAAKLLRVGRFAGDHRPKGAL